MKSVDNKYLVQRPKNKPTMWWMYYKITKELLAMPQYSHLSKNHIFAKSLGTDSLIEARRRRDAEIFNLHKEIDLYSEIEKDFKEKSKDFIKYQGGPRRYEDELKYGIVNEAIKQAEITKTPYKKNISAKNQLILNFLENKKTVNTKSLKYLLDLLINERKNDNAEKTLYKIKRGISWFLTHANKNDIDITKITFNEVSEYISKDKEADVAGSTIKGHLYGLSQIWQRARKSGILLNEINPFVGHRVKKNTKHYDPYTYDEVKQMYDLATDEIKLLIHAAYTTGARQGELLTCDVQVPDNCDFLCWMFKFQDAGKNEHSTRVVPLHSSILPYIKEGFKFTISSRTLIRDFKIIKDAVIVNKINTTTKKPRKLSFHSFRATFITDLVIQKKISTILVSAVTGHIGGVKEEVIHDYINNEELLAKQNTLEQIIW